MVAYLSKSNASEGFNPIIDFLNGSSIKYALTVNPNIYVSCIKQFWNTVVVKQVNDVTRLQALVDRKKVVITEAAIREVLRLDDAEGVDCLPNKEIFTEWARMGYEKPSTKHTFYKAFFSSQWKFLIHTILQCMKQEIEEEGDADEHVEEVNTGNAVYGNVSAAHGEVPIVTEEPFIPSPTPPTPPLQPPQDIPSTSQGRMIAKMDKDDAIVLMDDKEKDKKVEEAKEDETKPTEVQEVVDVVTTAKLITEVVTTASETVTAASVIIPTVEPQVPAATLTVAPARVTAAPSKRRKGVVIRDPEEESTTSIIIHAETKSKDKGKGILAIDHVKRKAKEDPAVQRYQVLKRKPQTEDQARKNMIVYLKNVAGFKMDYFKGMSCDDIRLIFEAKFNSNVAFLLKTKEKIKE
nr:xylulose kinase-1 [Tanacetum cinerariifolium]GEY31191.1 xylulose kinase-1 [Tanacetum cinerariifolium]